jgi:non-specific serine/threonine protein kinase
LSFFDGFSDVEIWETLRIASWRSLPERTTIIAEGERCESFYLLAEGEVDVTRNARQLAALGAGDCFGEMLYFSSDRTLRTTSVQTRSAVLVAEIKAAALSAASDRCQVQFNKTFIRILTNRLTEANKKLAER